MSTLLIASATWLHTLATVVFVGHYLFLSLVYLPLFERQARGTALRELLECVSSRLRPLFGGSLLVFLVTGTYLMLVNNDYQGLGHFFANPWSALMVVKHGLVLAFLVLAIGSERLLQARISDQEPRALRPFRLSLLANTGLGLVILLLTSAAQAI